MTFWKNVRYLLILVCLFPLGCLHQPVLTGELEGEIHWEGDVHLRGDVLLAEEARLTIAPGTHIFFHPPIAGEDRLNEHPYFKGSELIVRGQLIAEGTVDEPIFFQAADPQAPPGSWGGINIEDSVRASFDYCSFRQADSAVHARRSWVSIEHSIFSENQVGIRFHDTEILIERNLLQNNGAAIRFHFGAPVICKNLIRNNRKGLFITSSPWGYVIENNSFLNNRPYQVSLGEGVMETVDLKMNYWGNDTSAGLTAYLYDGRIDDWLGRVNYLPMRDTADPDVRPPWSR